MKELKDNRLILMALSLVCIITIGITTVKDSWLLPLRTGVGYILMPVQAGVNIAGRAIYNNIEENKKLRTVLDDNEKLNARINELLMENTRLASDSRELKRLRELYKLSDEYNKYHMVGARIIAKDSVGWFQVFRIDKGALDGIKADMNVLADGGLVGIVTDVGSNYATVRSIIDDVSRVSAMTLNSNENCIVAGDLQLYEQGKLRLNDIRQGADIKDGDKIVTSNISRKFLPGILIGYAYDIAPDPNMLTKSGYLVPVASFDTLQEVLIITELKEDYLNDNNDNTQPADN